MDDERNNYLNDLADYEDSLRSEHERAEAEQDERDQMAARIEEQAARIAALEAELAEAKRDLPRAIQIGHQHFVQNAEQAPSVLWVLEMLSREYSECVTSKLDLLRQLAEARKDGARLEWLSEKAKKSPTGISIESFRYVSEEESWTGRAWRLMWRHHIEEPRQTLRAAIDAASDGVV